MFCDGARAVLASNKAATFTICQKVAAEMERKAKAVAPWKDRTSHARQSINGGAEMLLGDMIRIHIAHGAKYGRYLEQGTQAHDILPHGKKALYWNGAPHPVKAVHHPGTKPMPAVLPAAEFGKQDLKAAVTSLWG